MRGHGPGPRDAAIVGLGAVFPGAADAPAFWRNISTGVDAVTDVPAHRWDPDVYFAPDAATGPAHADRFYCRRGGFVDDLATFDPTAFGIMPSAVDGIEPDQLMALRTTAEAIEDAGGRERLGDLRRVGVVFGRGGYMGVATARLDQRVRTAHQLVAVLRQVAPEMGETRLREVREAFQASLGPERPDASIGLVPSFTASRIANRLDFGGPAYTVDAACATSLVAVSQAVDELASGRCDTVIAGSVHHCHIATLWSVFMQLRALSPSMRIRPFDRSADGTLISEGTGAVVLKRLADAERDGDRIYAVVRGVGLSSDGRASSLMSPLVDGQVRALERAWQASGLDPTSPGAVGLVEAHGTATPVGDEAELQTLARVFGDGAGRRGGRVALGSVKSMIGHAMQASGSAGLLKAVLALHHGVLPPTLHVDDPHPGLAATRMRLVRETEQWDRYRRDRRVAPRRAAVNAFGFGGVNAHVIVEEPPAARPVALPVPRDAGAGRPAAGALRTPAAPDGPEMSVTAHGLPGVGTGRSVGGGGNDAAASATLPTARLLALSAATPADLLTALQSSGPDTAPPREPSGPCRLVVLEPTADTLALAARVVARGEPWHGRRDIWFAPRPLLGPLGPQGNRVALLFPGLEPALQPPIDDIAAFAGLDAPADARASDDGVVGRALAAMAAGRTTAAALARLGLRPDVMGGHSLGEWTAMVVAGMYPQSAVDVFLASLRPEGLELPDLVYAAVSCSPERAEALLHGTATSGRVVVSHRNCPHQCVVCGEEPDVKALVDAFRAQGVQAFTLPFRSGFHTPMWEPYLGQVRAAFTRLPLRSPDVPVWSATTAAPYPDEADDVRALTIRHLLEPVRFQDLTQRLYDSGVRAFVQAGSGSLTGFMDDTLRDRGDVLTVGPGGPHPVLPAGVAGLARIAAALWAEGLPLDLAAFRPAPRRKAPRAPRNEIRVDLGSPLVRLDDPPTCPPTLHPSPVPDDLSGLSDPVLALFGAVLTEAGESAREAVGALRSHTRARPARPAPTTEHREFSLTTDPYVIDHCVYEQPDWWPEPSDRFPVVPMTTQLDLAGEAARATRPGTLVTAYHDVKALRWLPVVPASRVEVRTEPRDDGRVRVTIAGHADATVSLAAAHPPPQQRDATPLSAETTPPVTAAGLYDDRWMFHGPGFAGVTEVSAVGDDGIRGVLTVLPAPGALLDAAGQVFGHWMQLRLPTDRLVFPVSIDRVDVFGPQPPTGTRVGVTARVRSVGAALVRGDVELHDPHTGLLYVRMTGWTYRRFSADDHVWPMKFTPHTSCIGEERPEGWCLVRTRWPDAASQELVMRRYLGSTERDEYAALAPRARAPRLLGRIAAKDAVRHLLWRGGEGPMYPAQIRIDRGPQGAPTAVLLQPAPSGGWREEDGPHVSIAHKGSLGVAVAGPGPVGIDIEDLDVDGPAATALEATSCTDAERALLTRLAPEGGPDRARWTVRLWCAKEAAAKREGTGLNGRPRDFAVIAVEPPRDGEPAVLTVRSAPTSALHAVRCTDLQLDDAPAVPGRFAVAWTPSVPGQPPEEESA